MLTRSLDERRSASARPSRRVFLRAATSTLGWALAGRPGLAVADLAPLSTTLGPVHTAAAQAADDVLTPAGRAPGKLSPLITPANAFYVVTKNAGGDPVVSESDWRLIVDGQVNRPVQLDYNLLRQLPAIEVVKTLECISNFTAKCELASFGCDLISTAAWKGARLADLFELAGGLQASTTSLLARAADEFTSSIPIEVALDPETLLVYEMNGAPLPPSHGFPVRVLVPGRYGYKSPKWVVQLSPQPRPVPDWYGQRNWSLVGVVKTMARIDSPAPGAELPAGMQTAAGIAYGGDRGISMVELSTDGGATWQPTDFLEPPLGRDAWVRWQTSFNLAAGATAQLVCRATDGTGQLQTEQFSLPQPDGGSGWHSLGVRGV